MFKTDLESLDRMHTELLRIINTNKSLSALEINAISDMIEALENVFGIQ